MYRKNYSLFKTTYFQKLQYFLKIIHVMNDIW